MAFNFGTETKFRLRKKETMPQTKEELITRINNDFVYHAPFGDQVARYAAIREYGRQMAIQIVQDTPVSREQSIALTHLENAIFYANAAIARNEREPLSTNDA